MVQNLNVFYTYIYFEGYNVILWLLIELQEEGQIILNKVTRSGATTIVLILIVLGYF